MQIQKNIPELGKFRKENLWTGKIRKSTATAIGRSGVINKAGIDNKAYVISLRGNLASGDLNEKA